MRFFALTTATADLPEVPDIQESLTAIQKFIKTASPVVLNALWHIALALVIFFVGRWLIEKFLSRVALLDNKTKIDPGVAKFVRSLVRVALWALLIYFIADFLGVPTASFVALLGSIGVTVGLALQGSLSNFAGGLILMFLHPFKTGDYIKTVSDIEGTVVEIGLFFTTLRMADNKIITIPNGNLSAGNIINYNVLPVRRLSTTVGIAYEADTARAIAEATGIPARCEPRLREQCFGRYEGTPRDGEEFRISKTHFADRYSGGESMMQLAQRIYNLLDELRADTDKTYLLVAHNGIARVVQSYFYDMTNEEYAAAGIKNCEFVEFTF